LFPLAVSLRQQGLRVETGYAPHLGKQMKRADRIEAGHVVILGDDEAARGVAILRSMVDGAQTEVALVDLVAHLLAQHKEQ
jgi:histidyl-tRNA synthetase